MTIDAAVQLARDVLFDTCTSGDITRQRHERARAVLAMTAIAEAAKQWDAVMWTDGDDLVVSPRNISMQGDIEAALHNAINAA